MDTRFSVALVYALTTLLLAVTCCLHRLHCSQDRLVPDAKSCIPTHSIGRLRER
jgi:hypothetical protein